jgi:PTH1 family peptidyl-tRNA hydrolase
MSEIKIIVGLGNPGEEYLKTRHNVGFRVLDALAGKENVKWKNFSSAAETTDINIDGIKVILAKPLKYMNNSGPVVNTLLAYYDILPSQMTVVVDDFSIPLGKIRLKVAGSSGGHNGLSSIIENLDTSDFPRLRLGIGPIPEKMDPKDFVLGKFSSQDKDQLEKVIDKAVETCYNIIHIGLEKAISKIGEK